MQRWPAAPNAAPTRALAVASGAASPITTAWFFAPVRSAAAERVGGV